MVCEVVDCTTEFELETLDGGFVGGVAEVAGCVEGFFDAEGVILHEMPPFGFFGETSSYTHGNHFVAVIKLERKSQISHVGGSGVGYLTKKAYRRPPRVSVFFAP